MLYRVLVVVLGFVLLGSVGVFAESPNCGSGAGQNPCSEVSDAEKSCLGNNPKEDAVEYFDGKKYAVGERNGDYCMRFSGHVYNIETKENDLPLQMGCDYVGSTKPSLSSSFEAKDFCCGVKLNTDVPFVGRCINQLEFKESTNTQAGQATAFPRLMRALANIVMTLILVGSIILLVVSGVMWTSGNPEQGKKMMRRVILSLVLLGASGIILRLINPVFFG